MLDVLDRAGWSEAIAYLASGEPPIYLRLVALNAFFLGLAGLRRAAGAEPFSSGVMLLVQLFILLANLAALYPEQAHAFALAFISRY